MMMFTARCFGVVVSAVLANPPSPLDPDNDGRSTA
jgi:hypothetical protein